MSHALDSVDVAGPSGPQTIDGARTLAMFTAAAAWLERNAEAINAVNVFPVPDGDTGSNMAATLRDAVAQIPLAPGAGSGAVAAAVAQAALGSARGNSGVILSQFLRGLARGVQDCIEVAGPALALALLRGSETADQALADPKEGTILTVMRAAATAAQAASGTADSILAAALVAAEEALRHTPDQLAELRAAGVVDAGGLGFVVLLEGALQGLRGQAAPASPHDAGAPDAAWLQQASAAHGAASPFGYCTEFFLGGENLAAEALHNQLQPLGDSLLVVGEPAALHIHVHTNDPGAALSIGTAAGRLLRVKIDNMQLQHERFAGAARQANVAPPSTVAVVAVLAGAGFAGIALGYGAGEVVAGGDTMNPSVAQLVEAIAAVPAEAVIVLPNNKNVILSAEQAAKLSPKRVVVLPTRSPAQGISALTAFDPAADLEQAAAAMREAAAAVHTIEVTRAARPGRINGIAFAVGQPIALRDGVLDATAGTLEEALVAALTALGPPAGAAGTLYTGVDLSEESAQAAERLIAAQYPELELQRVAGGQPHYPYMLGVE